MNTHIAAADRCKRILHNLDVLLHIHRNLSVSLTSDLDAMDLTGVGDSADIDVQGDVPGAGAVFRQADHHQAERLERLGHVQAADIQRA